MIRRPPRSTRTDTLFPYTTLFRSKPDEQYRLIAHRGGVVDRVTAENSLSALKKASENGYWMVEVDLRLTRDSVLIIHHDPNFKRYFGVDQAVSEMDWAEINQLVGNLGNKVLTFEEALRLCQAGKDRKRTRLNSSH